MAGRNNPGLVDGLGICFWPNGAGGDGRLSANSVEKFGSSKLPAY